MKKTSEWNFSQDIPSDFTVQIDDASFSLHKFPLVSKCGYIRRLVSESIDADVSFIELSNVPGGVEAFELAAKFCYGINFEISVENIAMLRCVAEYLEMTEDNSTGNLVGKSDSYLSEVALETISGAVSVLHILETIIPAAEKAKLVNRCIDAIAYIASKQSQLCSPARSDSSTDRVMSSSMESHTRPRPVVHWWGEDLTVLRIEIFQRVLTAMIARGFRQFDIGPIIMLYAQKSLGGLEIFGKGRKELEPQQEHEKRVVLETLVSLLPREENAMSVSSLSMLLRAAIYLETTVSCRVDLEKRVAMQLGQAVLDDLLIPSYSFPSNTLFDVDVVQRIMMSYLESEMGNHSSVYYYSADDEYFSPSQRGIARVGKLMENYLAEIAADRNLPVSKFISFAELIPEQSVPTEDGKYRAIDIYFKAHPFLSDMEKKKVCSLMECQKLSREARAHAAQNNRLPVQTVVQVLSFQQQSPCETLNDDSVNCDSSSTSIPDKVNVHSADELNPGSKEISTLQRENEELKSEIAKLKMEIQEIEKPALESAPSSPMLSAFSPSGNKPPLPRKSFMKSVSRKLGRLYPFPRADIVAKSAKSHVKPGKKIRHSIS